MSAAATRPPGGVSAARQSKPPTAEDARLPWEAIGVVPDPLSSTVTALGLPGDPNPLGAWLDAARAGSEPVVVALANLRRWARPPSSWEPLFPRRGEPLAPRRGCRWVAWAAPRLQVRPTDLAAVLLLPSGRRRRLPLPARRRRPRRARHHRVAARVGGPDAVAHDCGRIPGRGRAGSGVVHRGFADAAGSPPRRGVAARGAAVFEEDVRRRLVEAASVEAADRRSPGVGSSQTSAGVSETTTAVSDFAFWRRRGDPYSTPTLVLRAELALAG